MMVGMLLVFGVAVPVGMFAWVPVVVRVACSRAAAWASQADLRRDLQISQPAASPISRAQPRVPNPSDSAAGGVPAADGVGSRLAPAPQPTLRVPSSATW
jgi:hypothetical protein